MVQTEMLLIIIGIVLIVIGALFLVLGSFSLSLKELKEDKTKVGGVIIIGPVVIPFGFFAKYYKYFIPIAIILLILFIYFLIKR